MRIDYFSHPILRELAFLFPPMNLWRRRAIKIISKVLKEKKLTGKILEVGCGYGTLSRRLALLFKSYVYAIDISPKMIEMAKKNLFLPNLSFDLKDFFSLEERFKLIVSMHVMVLFDHKKWIKKLYGLLEEDGIAVITVTKPTPLTRLHRIFYKMLTGKELNLRNPIEVKEIAEGYGFFVEWYPIDPYEGSYVLVLSR
jgi:2-polyprenyl-3-methyl-5-hydroxy-6-metoxy-1,4-benzoquinol methylase